MKEIVLEECYDEKGVYLGKIVINSEELIPELLKRVREDTDDKLGWKKYRKVMKDNGIDVETAVQ
jgi:hypothetical protein